MKRRKIGLILALIISITAIAIVVNTLIEQNKADVIQIMDPIEANNLHMYLAEKLGYFNEENLNVKLSGTSAGKFAMDAVNAGAVEYGVVVEMNVAQTLFQHDNVAILAEIAEPITAIKLLGRRDHGIETAQDLAGKKIGVLFGVNIHLFVINYLEKNNVPLKQVELVNLRPPDAVAAFEKGDIDAVITWQPHVYSLQQNLGDKISILSEDAHEYWYYKMIVVTQQDYLKTHKEEAEALLRALIKADEYIRKRPDDAKRILAQRLELPVEAVDSFFDEIQFNVQLTPELLDMIGTEVEWLSESLHKGRTPATTDYKSLLAEQLSTVAPEAWELDK